MRRLLGQMQVGLAMERWFSVEAKAFCFTAKEGSNDLWLEERRKGFVWVIRVGPQSAVWLEAKVEEACQSQAKEGSVSDFREDEKCFMVRKGCNKACRFLEVAIEAEGGRIGSIWLPEGKKGCGWR